MRRLFLMHFFVLVITFSCLAQSDYFDPVSYKQKRVSERLFNEAVDAVKVEDYYGALFFLDSAISLQPTLSPAYIERGKIYYSLNRKDDAATEFYAVLGFEPNNGEAMFYKTYVNFTADTSSVTSLDFDMAIQNGYKEYQAYYYRGLLKLLEDKYNDAIADFTLAIELNGNYAKAYHDRGTAKLNLGDYQGAIYDYRLAITYDPKLIMAYLNMGTAKKKLGDYQGAEQDYTVAINIDSTSAVPLNNRGGTRYILGNLSGAEEDFNRAYEIDSISPSILCNMGNIAAKKGDYQGAIDWYNASLDINPQYSTGYLNRGLTHEMLGMLSEACADWQMAADMGSEEAETYLTECNQ